MRITNAAAIKIFSPDRINFNPAKVSRLLGINLRDEIKFRVCRKVYF